MSKKGENIFKRNDGRWEARYEKGRTPDGKIIYGYCYAKSYREVRQKVGKLKADVIEGRSTDKNRLKESFEIYCESWLNEKKAQVKQSSYVKYSVIINNHIRPLLGKYRLLSINTEACTLLKEKMLEADYSPKMVRDVLTILRSVLKYVHKKNPAFQANAEIILPRSSQKEMHVLSFEEEKQFVKFLLEDLDNCRFGILLAIMTGLRIGEICALKWSEISLSEGTIHVVSTMQRLKQFDSGGNSKTAVVTSSPKSETSLRTIPLSAECLSLCEKMYCGDPEAYILTASPNYMEPRALQYRMKKYAEQCGLPDVHFHTLRHTFATRAVEAGFDVKSLSEILGHANTTITLDRYVHSSLQLKRKNMEKLPVLIG